MRTKQWLKALGVGALSMTMGCRACVTVDKDEVSITFGAGDEPSDDPIDYTLDDNVPMGEFNGAFQMEMKTDDEAHSLVALTGRTTLPDGTLYRMHMTRRIEMNPPKEYPTIRHMRLSPYAGIFLPEPSRIVQDAPEIFGTASKNQFGVVQHGKLSADFEMLLPEVQTYGAEGDPTQYRIDREHVFVQVWIQRAVQDPEVAEQLQKSEITFVLRLDVPLSTSP